MPPTPKNDSPAAMWTFVAAASLCGLLYLGLIAPFAAPDESSHFARAWWVSKGHLLAVRQGPLVGYLLPRELPLLWDRLRLRPTVRPALIVSALHDPPAGSSEVFVDSPGHATASVILYIPQGLGIALGRAAKGSPLLCFYLGRILNLIAGCVLIAFAIRIMPSHRWLMALLALTPMNNHLRSSMSGDVVTIGIAFLFTAFAARALLLDDEPLSRRRWAAVNVLGAALCLTKVTYIPLAMLPLIVPRTRFPTPSAAWRARAMHAAIVIAAAAISSKIATAYWAPSRTDVTTPGAQMRFIAAHPLSFAGILFDEYVVRAKWYLISMIGDLGSGERIVVLPKLLVIFFFACLLLLALTDTNRRLHVTALQRIYFAAICTASAFAVAFAIYTTWNPVGWGRIDGLQGRYYLPFVPAGALIVHRSA